MKRIPGGRRILRGTIDTGTYSGFENRIQLFDGKYTTGWRIEKFVITPTGPVWNRELAAMISTEPKSALGVWKFNDVQQLAWCSWNAPNEVNGSVFELVDETNLVVEDMWIQAYTTGEATTMNYYIVLQQYEFPSWDGAATLVKNLSQAGPQ